MNQHTVLHCSLLLSCQVALAGCAPGPQNEAASSSTASDVSMAGAAGSLESGSTKASAPSSAWSTAEVDQTGGPDTADIVDRILPSDSTSNAIVEEALAYVDSGKVLAQTDRVQVIEDGDWVRHYYRQAIAGSSFETHSGARIVNDAGEPGCDYHFTSDEDVVDLDRKDLMVSREVAHNLATCELTMETGILPVELAIEQGLAQLSDTGLTTDSVHSQGSGLSTNSTTAGRYQKLYYEDPPQIDVTSVTARVRWTYNGTCTTWGKGSAHWGWLKASGWERTSKWWAHETTCEHGATTSQTGEYKNTKFCATIDTWNRYNTNYIQGRSNGKLHYEWDAQKWGGCNQLLSFHRETGNWAG